MVEKKDIRMYPVIALQSADKQKNTAASSFLSSHWYEWKYLPLSCSLLLALILHTWLVVHSRGVIDGDVALVGLQANHILHGERPAYFYGQAYMGSLEAYIAAALFLIFGSSVATLYGQMIASSLVVVWLTWLLAGTLARQAGCSRRTQAYFQGCSVLFVAVSPLYDTVLELRAMGGYVETFILMQLLLLFTLWLTHRWRTGASRWLLLRYWMAIGFVLGLGIWINPLISSAVLTMGLWLVGMVIWKLTRWRRQAIQSGDRRRLGSQQGVLPEAQQVVLIHGVFCSRVQAAFPIVFSWLAMKTLWQAGIALLFDLVPALALLPTLCLGMLPALIWGAGNNWLNLVFIFKRVNKEPLKSLQGYTDLYLHCTARRVIGGALPGESQQFHFLHTLPLILGTGCIALCVALLILSLVYAHQPLLIQIRQLVLLPIVFGFFTYVAFTMDSLPPSKCVDHDLEGRFGTPLFLVLPLLYAAACTFVLCFVWQRWRSREDKPRSSLASSRTSFIAVAAPFATGLLIGVQVAMVGCQATSYLVANPGLTFQSAYCRIAPADNGPLIAYMQREHIHYAWASHWIGEPIRFKTHEQIIVDSPVTILKYIRRHHVTKLTPADRLGAADLVKRTERLSQPILSIFNADRPGFITFIRHGDPYPELLRVFDALHIHYRYAIFPSQPGYDMVIAMPLNRTVELTEYPDFIFMFGCENLFGSEYQV